MVVRDENFPILPVVRADRMVSKVAIGIGCFLVEEPCIDIGIGVRRLMYDSKDTAMGQRSPCDRSILCTAISMPIKDLFNPFAVLVKVKMLFIINSPAMVNSVIASGVIAPLKIFGCHVLLYCKKKIRKYFASLEKEFF